MTTMVEKFKPGTRVVVKCGDDFKKGVVKDAFPHALSVRLDEYWITGWNMIVMQQDFDHVIREEDAPC